MRIRLTWLTRIHPPNHEITRSLEGIGAARGGVQLDVPSE